MVHNGALRGTPLHSVQSNGLSGIYSACFLTNCDEHKYRRMLPSVNLIDEALPQTFRVGIALGSQS